MKLICEQINFHIDYLDYNQRYIPRKRAFNFNGNKLDGNAFDNVQKNKSNKQINKYKQGTIMYYFQKMTLQNHTTQTVVNKPKLKRTILDYFQLNKKSVKSEENNKAFFRD